jgi:hypothetical protein
MAYSVTNPPNLIVTGPVAGASRVWSYRSTDDAATVRASNYFTNGQELGMRVGDFVLHNDTDAGTPTGSISVITAVTASGATPAALT